MPTQEFQNAALDRARKDLRLFQDNLMVQLQDGSELRAVWDGQGFLDYQLGEPLPNVCDFWVDERFPEGGFTPNQFGLKLC